MNREGERKECIVLVAEKGVNGYMTLEMTLVFPAVFALVIMILYTAFFLYDKCRMTQDLYMEAYRQSIVRGKTAPPMNMDISAYFMMKECSCTLSTGSEIRAEAAGQMTPALVTGTGKAVFELKVTMKARKTDPPYAFRKYRRITSIVRQAMPKQE